MLDVNLLRAEMARKGKTQTDLAKIIGISQNSMSRKMNGSREFKLSEVVRICECLEIEDPAHIFLTRSSHLRNDN